ncbi:uncharacterized protein LOC143896089 [Temnothorax americanus]|uniref:uncharacterized protein LOC143896089 n=1 Tax=Temnothorax americanus TaxID=1964332 RepID=UPI0040693738
MKKELSREDRKFQVRVINYMHASMREMLMMTMSTSQTLSSMDTFLQFVDACVTQKCQSIEDIFNDNDSMGSLSDVREYCITNVTECEIKEFRMQNSIMDDIEDVEDVENVQDIEHVENVENVQDIAHVEDVDNIQDNNADVEDINDVEDVHQDIEDVENVENVEDIENYDLHVEHGNIDAGRLCSAQIGGRCFVDFGHVFAELQKLSAHWINECRFTDLVITKIKRVGLKIKFIVECRMCHYRSSFWSEPTDDRKLDVNRGIVAGTILTGTGHKQLEELLAAVDVTCMSNKTYISFHNEMSEAFAAAAEEEMRMAGEEERRLAIERGDVIDGVPHIPVITDGSWMKRF